MSSVKPANLCLVASRGRAVIGIDASRAAGPRLTGTERYSQRIIAGILKQEPAEAIRLYVNGDAPLPFDLSRSPDARQVNIPFPRLWTHIRLSAELARHWANALFVPSHVVPPIHPRATVVTIHDLGYLYEPGAHPTWSRRYLDLSTRWSVFAASRVIAVSDATRRDLIERYRVSPSKIEVIPHGVDERFQDSGSQPKEAKDRLGQLGIRPPYLVFLGTIQPRKNLVRLIAAFDQIAGDYPELRLVLAGGSGWLAQPIQVAVEQSSNENRIVLPGHVADDLLPALYRSASAAVFPSLYEGFGIPAAEAMASGTPVVVSDRGALPEVVGQAGILVDPLDVESIAAGIREALDPATVDRRVEAGRQRATAFSWDTAAKLTLDVIRRAMEDAEIDR